MKTSPRRRRSAEDLIAPYRVTSGRGFSLARIDPADTLWFAEDDKDRAQDDLKKGVKELADLQDKLYAQDRWSVLLIFQAMDAAGKDGAIKHVFSGINPQGCHVTSFKAPSQEELDHDYLWRCFRALPERGRIGIFNRSYYEEVLVVRVHDELLARAEAPAQARDPRHLGRALRGHPRLSSATWSATGRSSASSSCTFPGRSSGSDSSHDSTSPRRTGSSPPGTCASVRTGTSTCGRTSR